MGYRSKVLIIGDEEVGAEKVKAVLATRGFRVVAVEETCDTAFLKIQEFQPDLVIIGTILKGRLDGFATAKEIRQRYHMPILFLAPQSEQLFLRHKKRLYPAGYILDANDIEWLLASVTKALRNKKKMESEKWRIGKLIERILKRNENDDIDNVTNHLATAQNRTNSISGNTFSGPGVSVDQPESVSSIIKDRKQENGKADISLADIVQLNAKALIKPYICNLKNSELNPKQKAILEGLEKNIEEVVSPFLYRLSDRYFNLTTAELRVARLIKSGQTTKEIASQLNLSVSTINTHRDRIRKKLGIKGKKQNLRRFLEQLE